MKNFVENQGIKTDKPLPMSYEALKAERDALAVENENQRDWINKCSELWDAGCDLDNLLGLIPETPATAAALAAIQAQGVERFADDLHKTAMAMCSVKPDNTTPAAYAVMARSFAKKLREAK